MRCILEIILEGKEAEVANNAVHYEVDDFIDILIGLPTTQQAKRKIRPTHKLYVVDIDTLFEYGTKLTDGSLINIEEDGEDYESFFARYPNDPEDKRVRVTHAKFAVIRLKDDRPRTSVIKYLIRIINDTSHKYVARTVTRNHRQVLQIYEILDEALLKKKQEILEENLLLYLDHRHLTYDIYTLEDRVIKSLPTPKKSYRTQSQTNKLKKERKRKVFITPMEKLKPEVEFLKIHDIPVMVTVDINTKGFVIYAKDLPTEILKAHPDINSGDSAYLYVNRWDNKSVLYQPPKSAKSEEIDKHSRVIAFEEIIRHSRPKGHKNFLEYLHDVRDNIHKYSEYNISPSSQQITEQFTRDLMPKVQDDPEKVTVVKDLILFLYLNSVLGLNFPFKDKAFKDAVYLPDSLNEWLVGDVRYVIREYMEDLEKAYARYERIGTYDPPVALTSRLYYYYKDKYNAWFIWKAFLWSEKDEEIALAFPDIHKEKAEDLDQIKRIGA
jgi:hypothetical protein